MPALSKLRFAGSMLEELKRNHGDWQPAIVDYRSRKIADAILRVQSKISTQSDLAATAGSPAPESKDLALPKASPAEPSVEITVRRTTTAPADLQAAIQDATKELRAQVDALEAELKKSQQDISSPRRRKSLNSPADCRRPTLNSNWRRATCPKLLRPRRRCANSWPRLRDSRSSNRPGAVDRGRPPRCRVRLPN